MRIQVGGGHWGGSGGELGAFNGDFSDEMVIKSAGQMMVDCEPDD